jgi:NADPH-dependent glutamate synthase beta subunit-like oxidoreductase
MSQPGFKVEIPQIGYWTRMVSCQRACPVRTDARGYVRAIAEGDYERAYIIAREPNPFASICGRVCAAPCEAACRRGSIDTPIAIRALKRFVTEQFGVEAALGPKRPPGPLGADLVLRSTSPPETRGSFDLSVLRQFAADARPGSRSAKVAVIGSGVAGLTCAHDLTILGHQVTVFEAQSVPGGMLVLGVPEYRLPRELVRAEIQAILDLGVQLELNTALGKQISLQDLRRMGYEAIFLAIGAHKSRDLRLEGIQADGVFRAVEFLLNVNLGFRVQLGEKVIIVGGGDVAMDAARSAARELMSQEMRTALDAAMTAMRQDPTEALASMREAMDVAREALRSGAREVKVVCLESWEEMPAQRFEIEEALAEGVRIIPRLGPKRILAKDGRVCGLETLAVRSIFDAQGRFNPSFIEGSESMLEADSIIMAIGQTSDLDFLRPEDGVAVTPRGTIQVDRETLATTAPGIYAGGDVAFGARIFIEGVENGHRAARAIHSYLTGTSVAVGERMQWRALDPVRQVLVGEPGTGPRLPLVNADFLQTKREAPPALPIERRIGIAEVELPYLEPAAQAQGRRCLTCSINTIFHGDRCILCGGCVDICPTSCLRMVPVNRIEGNAALERLVQARYGIPLAEFAEDSPVRTGGTAMIPQGPVMGTAMIKDETRCIRCGLCALRCPTGAITMEQFTFQEILTPTSGQ